MEIEYQVCSRCVMDSTAKDIQLLDDDTCNYCNDFLNRDGYLFTEQDAKRRDKALDALVEAVKKEGRGKPYDCVVGVSGGVDSSWALVKAVELGLRPLAVHMDNGWNSELAQNNIANLVQTLGVDLYTYVIDWDEYRLLMEAFFDADVIDIELLYDNAMLAVTLQQLIKYKLKYMLTGSNSSTEGMRMPESWNWFKYDKRNIKAIAKQFRNFKLKTFPAVGTFSRVWYEVIGKKQRLSFLNYFSYNKADALKELQEKYRYKPYLYKHYESVFTRFYQGYILPEKFGVDKRRQHLSSLIISGQLTREEAMQTLEHIPYESEEALSEDKDYFLKKMGWKEDRLEIYLKRPEKSHAAYPSERKVYQKLVSIYERAVGR